MINLTGGCACQAIQYASDDPAPRAVIACHCKQCRQFTGYTFASTAVKRDHIQISGLENLTWFESSARARRGFCKVCGSALFWDQHCSDTLSIAVGTVDQEEVLKFGWHIYVDDQPAFYELSDDCIKYAVDADGDQR